MKGTYVVALLTAIVLFSSFAGTMPASKKRKHKDTSTSTERPLLSPQKTKTKTKTKWSSSTDLGAHSTNSMVATEEHGYYIKRTYLPLNDGNNSQISSSGRRQSPTLLAVPIAWYKCTEPTSTCLHPYNSLMLNTNSLQEGFLCDDDCIGPYQPICGKTATEVAVFYNLCKLNVVKCRTHGFWTELSYPECQRLYTTEVRYAEKKFRASPFFKEAHSGSNKTEKITNKPISITSNYAENSTIDTLHIQELSDYQPLEKQHTANDNYKAS